MSKRTQFNAYIQLMRLDRPIGTELVLWPTLIALWIASDGQVDWSLVLIFSLGALFMRAAGCVINDFADRKIDGHVARTQFRPLATGVISSKSALILFVCLLCLSATLLLFLPTDVFIWSWGALILATIYPFMKRFTYWPQLFLALAFSWAIPMAYVGAGHQPDLSCWLLFFANIAWTLAYDTQYAIADRQYDLKIGVKSTAILFGRYDIYIIALLHILSMLLFIAAASLAEILPIAAVGVIIAFGLFIYQFIQSRTRNPQACFLMFLNNRWVGRSLFFGTILGYVFK